MAFTYDRSILPPDSHIMNPKKKNSTVKKYFSIGLDLLATQKDNG